MKIAHLIFVHNRPNQAERLIKKLISERADIYIHVDKKSNINQFDFSELQSKIYFIKNRVAMNWGNYSMVKAMVNSLEEILQTGVNYSHINLLSGQDYPLQPVEKLESFLLENKGKTFMRYLLIPNEWNNAAERLIRYNLGDWKLPGKYKIQHFINRYFPERKFPKHLQPYGGSAWFIITPECTRYVLDYLRDNPKLTSFIKYIWAVDEIVFQTVLVNSPHKDTIVNENLRYIHFKGESPHPTVFTKQDAETLLQSGKFFARKFCLQVDSEILDYLDAKMN